ncbi:unnamed protein product [Xylocopa violacea]|uniref:Uncharacterized protein n=1 Tax=Xylocopa violacea TaxID=135666 RepID=A0ABP1NFL1_XYLVO
MLRAIEDYSNLRIEFDISNNRLSDTSNYIRFDYRIFFRIQMAEQISTHVHKHLRHHRHHRQMVLLRLVHLVYQVLQALQGHQGLLDLPGHQDHDEEFESTLRLLQCLHCPEEGTDRSSESLNLARRHHAATLREIEIEDRK